MPNKNSKKDALLIIEDEDSDAVLIVQVDSDGDLVKKKTKKSKSSKTDDEKEPVNNDDGSTKKSKKSKKITPPIQPLELLTEKKKAPPIIDIGDTLKLKQTLDFHLLHLLHDTYPSQNFFTSNLKILLMLIACIFATVAQFGSADPSSFSRRIEDYIGFVYPFARFPSYEGRVVLGVCCVVYFGVSGGVTVLVNYYERDVVFEFYESVVKNKKATKKKVTSKPVMKKFEDDSEKFTMIRVRTSLGKYDSVYRVSFESDASSDKELKVAAKERAMNFNVGDYFTIGGVFDEHAFVEDCNYEVCQWRGVEYVEAVREVETAVVVGSVDDSGVGEKKEKKEKKDN